MPITKTKAAEIAAEAALDKAIVTKTRAKSPPVVPAAGSAPAAAPALPAYRLTDFVLTEKDSVTSWTATLRLGEHPAAKAIYSGPKRVITVAPLASTTGAATEVERFERTAAQLLGGTAAVSNLLSILTITSETAITSFNRALMLKDIAGSEPYAMRPELIVAV